MSNDELLGLCEDLDDTEGVSLTRWEAEFLDSCIKILESKRSLTPTQERKLKTLWDDKVG